MQEECNAAVRAVVLTVTVARVLDVLVAVFRVERDHTQTVGQELVGKDRCVFLYFYNVDCHCWDLGEHYSSEGVGEGQVNGAQFEVDAVWFRLDCRSGLVRILSYRGT